MAYSFAAQKVGKCHGVTNITAGLHFVVNFNDSRLNRAPEPLEVLILGAGKGGFNHIIHKDFDRFGVSTRNSLAALWKCSISIGAKTTVRFIAYLEG